MIIYKVTNKLNGKIYIGQTTQALKERWRQHCHRSPSQLGRSHLFNAIKTHGVENFEIVQIDTASGLEELNIKEATYIKALGSLSPAGYNLHPGGESKVCHETTKELISKTMKKKDKASLFGGKRMNGAPRGRPVSPERRARISATMTGVAQPWKYKAVTVVETGAVYPSVNAAAEALNTSRVTVSALLKSGKPGRLGLTFKFVKEAA